MPQKNKLQKSKETKLFFFPQIDECLRLVLAYEIVLGKGVKSDGEIGNFVTKYGESLTEEWLKLEESGDTQNNSQGVQGLDGF